MWVFSYINGGGGICIVEVVTLFLDDLTELEEA